MLKKIQEYLLLHYPLLWNVKIIPALLGIIVINILFFSMGYFSTEIDFNNSYYYSGDINSGFTYFGAVIFGMLYLIFWLISYSKNNSFKVFYPKTSRALYLEWILVFVIVLGVSMFSFSYYQGSAIKVKSYMSKSDMEKGINVLNMVDILIPQSKNDYYKEYPDDYNNSYVEKGFADSSSNMSGKKEDDSVVVSDSLQYDEYTTSVVEDINATFEGYPDFRQLSLLNYNGYNSIYIPSKCDFEVLDRSEVIGWLKNQDKEKISQLMDDFLALQKKHGLKSNLTKEKWLELIYNPSKYPVGDFNLISRSSPNGYYSSSSDPYRYYLPYSELSRSYNNIMDAYLDADWGEGLLLTAICFSLAISLFIFSFRATSGKSWLIALVSMGLILIVDSFFGLISSISADINGFLLYIIVLLILFALELFYLIGKVSAKGAKGRSNVVINHFIWFIPAVPVLIYSLIFIISKTTCDYSYNYYYETNPCLYSFLENNMLLFVWGNVCLTFISMWFFIRFILLKWKGLPEE